MESESLERGERGIARLEGWANACRHRCWVSSSKVLPAWTTALADVDRTFMAVGDGPSMAVGDGSNASPFCSHSQKEIGGGHSAESS